MVTAECNARVNEGLDAALQSCMALRRQFSKLVRKSGEPMRSIVKVPTHFQRRTSLFLSRLRLS